MPGSEPHTRMEKRRGARPDPANDESDLQES
jgi:hypothetical protein